MEVIDLPSNAISLPSNEIGPIDYDSLRDGVRSFVGQAKKMYWYLAPNVMDITEHYGRLYKDLSEGKDVDRVTSSNSASNMKGNKRVRRGAKSAKRKQARGYGQTSKKRKYNGSSKGRRVATTSRRGRRGATGVYGLRRGARPKVAKASYRGIQLVTENGGVIDDPNCVYVGHASSAPQTELTLTFYSVYRLLMTKANITFTNWDSTDGIIQLAPSKVYRIDVFFITGPDNVGESRLSHEIFNVAPLPSHNTAAAGFGQFMQQSVYTTGTEEVKRFVLSEVTPAVEDKALSIVSAEDITICGFTKSILVIQNRTRDDSSQTSRLINSVTNNPLKGYRYECRGKGFRVQTVSNVTDANNQIGAGWGANSKIGLIAARGDFTNPSLSKKPMLPTDFKDVTRVNKISVTSGLMRRDVLTFKWKKKYNKLIDMYSDTVKGNITTKGLQYENYGRSSMVGLEKVMNTGEASINVNIGYQLERHYSCFAYERKKTICPRLVDLSPGYVMQ
jgi:hypothetical protein